MTQSIQDAAAKIKVLLRNSRPSVSRKDSNIEALVLTDIRAVVAVVITIAIFMTNKFFGGFWLCPLPQDLFST